jgi:hypothetical protein
MALMASKMPCLMVSQHVLKKAPVNPSGPGALTEGKEKTARLTSSSVKSVSSQISI